MSAPTIPPRPSGRSQAPPTALKPDIPQIPPRPHRRSEQSQSPSREAFSRSPLNEPPTSIYGSSSFGHRRAPSIPDLPPRPPSVNLPSIGQEGVEYAGVSAPPPESTSGSPEHTRNIAADLPMHQPTASVPQSTAKSRIQTVTRTDSSQAAAAGVGKIPQVGDKDTDKHSLKAKASFNRSNQNLPIPGSSRPASVHEVEHDHGIPEIGIQVPMYPNAGDVQAPSPAPTAPPHSAGIGFFNDGSQRHHHRRRSSRQEFNPPGSYGMHGHGVEPKDKFERAWYQRHPEELQKELHHEYDPGHARGQYALSSEDLNKLVHGSTNRGLGPSESPDNVGTPTEQIVYRTISVPLRSRPSSSSHAHVESPLRKSSFPFNDNENNHAIDDETDNETVHVHPPSRKTSKAEGSASDTPTGDVAPKNVSAGEEDQTTDEDDYDMPILAADEVAKYPRREYLSPAVDPEQQLRGDGYQSGYDSEHHHTRKGSHGRPISRPTSQHGEPLAKLLSHDRYDGSGVGTPLEEIQEYEPLFPDDDDNKAKTVADQVKKRPDTLARHHFPSQDVWEDNPNSLALTATVSTPQLPEEEKDLDNKPSAEPSKVFEHPDAEASRKDPKDLHTDRADYYLPQSSSAFAKPQFKRGVMDDLKTRPGGPQRFPSRDIWEDSPDSLRLETTVGTPQTEEITSPPDTTSRPDIPARPQKGAAISDKPKPQVPTRPAAKSGQGITPLSKEVSPEATSPPEAKAKPAVPSRPAGGKFASIKASFMNDLNSRLQLGPQGPPPKQQESTAEEANEEEKAPLADARKGRARGPTRRKPAASPLGAFEAASSSALSLSAPHVLFSIDERGALDVPGRGNKSIAPVTDSPEQTTDVKSSNAAPIEPATSVADEKSMSGLPQNTVGAEGDSPNPRLSQGTIDRQEAIQPMLSEALATSEKSVQHEDASVHAPQATAGQVADSSVQTGTQDISITSPTGEKQTLTTYLGGKAPEEGNVVVKGTEEDASVS